ncbi:fungal-specific transcription factor domain-containing protein [Papiliotrema laurentii]|uniref:Fungal-specific transcription factor domain-containing protein n=1 Tax=Papiliotrema laurentii TaxID=5418 RepID=A0AAD9FPL9_PAPLA|nr:fungal-specific transcription factor domain-containing protein [Papiliotrema laurentii]
MPVRTHLCLFAMSPVETDTPRSTDLSPHALQRGRKRGSLACVRCRARRSRCSGNKPVCQQCRINGDACDWVERKKRARMKDKSTRPSGLSIEVHDRLSRRPSSPAIESSRYLIPTFDVVDSVSDHPTSLGSSTEHTAAFRDPSIGSSLLVQTEDGSYPPVVLPPRSDELLPADHMSTARVFQGAGSTDPQAASGSSSQSEVTLCYYRFSGTTAMQPGIQRIRVRMRKDPGSIGESSTPAQTTPVETLGATVDARTGLPHESILRPCIDVFFSHIAQFYPSIERKWIESAIASGTMSSFLAIAMCAIASPFVPQPKAIGDQLYERAKQMTIDVISFPSIDICEALLLLAWCAFAKNSDGLCWQYFGMGARMALDLGLHKPPEKDDHMGEQESRRQRMCMWTVVMMDRILTFMKGMHITIPEEPLEIALPDPLELPSLTADNVRYCASPFPHALQLMILAGRIANVYNRPDQNGSSLQALRQELHVFHRSLPPNLVWTNENFRAHVTGHQAGILLFLHVWSHALLAHLQPRSVAAEVSIGDGSDGPSTFALTCARLICDRVVTADAHHPASYLASPFVVQPLYIATRIFLDDFQAYKESTGSDDVQTILAMISQQNIHILVRSLHRMEIQWAGVGQALTLLHDRAAAIGAESSFTHDRREVTSVISLPDTGILRRYTSASDDGFQGPLTRF